MFSSCPLHRALLESDTTLDGLEWGALVGQKSKQLETKQGALSLVLSGQICPGWEANHFVPTTPSRTPSGFLPAPLLPFPRMCFHSISKESDLEVGSGAAEVRILPVVRPLVRSGQVVRKLFPVGAGHPALRGIDSLTVSRLH